jgi:hypothetical protein
MFDPDKITKTIGIGTAAIAFIGGGYSLSDKIGFFKKPILEWAPEYFSISNGPANSEFHVVVARKKYRDDCSVEDFYLEVRDSGYNVHKATPSIAKFSGPAGPDIDKFAYGITIQPSGAIATGTATLLAHIKYKCPEGETVINYPKHKNLTFEITKSGAGE